MKQTELLKEKIAVLEEYANQISEVEKAPSEPQRRMSAKEIRDKYTRAWFNEEDDLDDPTTGHMPWPEVLEAMVEFASQPTITDEVKTSAICKGCGDIIDTLYCQHCKDLFAS